MPDPEGDAALRQRLRELEARLQESEDTLDAIRRGAIDALVVSGGQQHRVYTLESADRPYRVLIEQMREGAVTLSPDGTILYGNRRLSEMLELPQEQVIGRDLGLFLPEGERRILAWLLREGGRGELTLRGARGGEMPVAASLGWLAVEGEGAVLCGVLSDLSAQRAHLQEVSRANALLRAEIAQREAAEAALRQSQKMEAVGQLTGGIAHDFNNLLTGITGSLELMQEAVLRGRIVGLERYVASAMASAHRAAALTHRLLAFSRRQTLAPQPLSPNRLVEGMAELLSRTVGPAIALRTELADDAGTILCDPSQMENALLNLAINARDAMPDGGTLVIGTANVPATPEACREAGMAPGPCVALFVSDTGIGMSPETAARAFDPFFTTKPAGEGTGLGLSMIYGFARQSGGQAMIESALGQGTTVWLYLPRHEGMAEEAPQDAVVTPAAGRGETVLLVDDEAVIRMLMGEALRKLGYATLEAADGPTALRLLQGGERLDLMVTDLGLPGGLNGRELAEAARRTQPGLKVLFITGFAEAAGLDARGLDAGAEMLPKPFSLEALATRIRAMLDRPPPPA